MRYRLWLANRYAVRPWPFAEAPETVIALPAHLPQAIDDLDVFLPDDHVNATHGPLPRQASRVRTEFAVYRHGDGLIVVQRFDAGPALPVRHAPANPDNGQLIAMADAGRQDGLYIGVNDKGESLVTTLDGLRPDDSHSPMRHLPGPAGVTVRTIAGDGCWHAVYTIPIAAIPGASPDPSTLAFTIGRLWGETFEPSAWTSPLSWAPMLSLMGTLDLSGAAAPDGLYRADVDYDATAERAELLLTLRGANDAPITLTVNTEAQTLAATGDQLRCPLHLEDGMNHLGVKVGERRTVHFSFEKWSGHRLYPRPVADPPPYPTTADLRTAFAAWHERTEATYVAPGTWYRGKPSARYGLDHHCAFVMEPYAWACLCLDRQPIYEARIRESCERIVASIKPEGWLPCYHHAEDPTPFMGGAFGHGSASEALCLGYRVLGDQRYLDAAIRTAEAYRLYALEYNTNYMAFVLWHLAELYELTGEERWLDVAAWYTEHGILRGLTPGGNFPGHNYYTGYGNITLKGMAKLWRVLPTGHPLREPLAEASLRFTNQILSRQLANGLFDGRNRMYFGYMHTVPGLYEVARAAGPPIATQLGPVFRAMYHGQTAKQRAGGSFARDGLDIAFMARYLGES